MYYILAKHTYFNIWHEAYLFCVHVTWNVSRYAPVVKHMKILAPDIILIPATMSKMIFLDSWGLAQCRCKVRHTSRPYKSPRLSHCLMVSHSLCLFQLLIEATWCLRTIQSIRWILLWLPCASFHMQNFSHWKEVMQGWSTVGPDTMSLQQWVEKEKRRRLQVTSVQM